MIAVMIAGVVAGIVSLFVTRALITVFRTRGLGQPILGKEDRGPSTTWPSRARRRWAGSPSSSPPWSAGWCAHVREGLPFSTQALIVWVGILAMATMGFLDDFIKVRKRHNRGIFWKQKNYVTLLMSFGIAWWLVVRHGHLRDDLAHPCRLPGMGGAGVGVGDLRRLIIWATTNAVNVTDGLDGLAGGSALMGFGAFMIIGFTAFRFPEIYGGVVNPLDLTAARRRLRRRLSRVPLVQRRAGTDHHGRRRRARSRLGAGDARADHEHPAAAAADLRAQRDRSRLGRPADGRVQGERDARGGCSGCRRSTTTSSSSAGRRRR